VPSTPHARILDTATRLFYQEGIRAVGVNRVIAEADVAQMTPYRQFGGKDELVAATLRHWSTNWLRDLEERLDRSGDDPLARFAALWDWFEAWSATPDFRGSYATNAAIELRGDPDHPAQEVIAAHRAGLRQLLAELVQEAGARDAMAAATWLLMLVEGAVGVAVSEGPRAIAFARTLAAAALADDR
jgi:AcrR family transcriptional regulator